MLQQEALLCQC